jgi:hypothetical protein
LTFTEFKYDGKSILGNRIKHLLLAFISIPAIISSIVVGFAKISGYNLFSIIPDNLFNSVYSLTVLGTVQMATYMWFKLLMAAQSLLIGLLGLEIVVYNLENFKSEDLNKYIDYYKKFHGKSLNKSSWLSRTFFELRAWKVVWKAWIQIILIYFILVFAVSHTGFSIF